MGWRSEVTILDPRVEDDEKFHRLVRNAKDAHRSLNPAPFQLEHASVSQFLYKSAVGRRGAHRKWIRKMESTGIGLHQYVLSLNASHI